MRIQREQAKSKSYIVSCETFIIKEELLQALFVFVHFGNQKVMDTLIFISTDCSLTGF